LTHDRTDIRRVCSAIWECLREESFPELTEERWKEIAKGFQKYSQFTNCLVDEKHQPRMNGSLFYNYKIVLFNCIIGVCISKIQFHLHRRWSIGKESDSTVFERSNTILK